jgi:hypothetical protein
MVVFLKNGPALQRNGPQQGQKPREGRRRKAGQQPVLDQNRLLMVGSIQRTLQRYPMEFSPPDRALCGRYRGCFPGEASLASIRGSRNPTFGEAWRGDGRRAILQHIFAK